MSHAETHFFEIATKLAHSHPVPDHEPAIAEQLAHQSMTFLFLVLTVHSFPSIE